MPPENRFFEDIARVANGALGAMAGLRGEVEAMVRQRFERLTADMNMVGRDEFDALRDMVAKARNVQEDSGAQIAALEARIAALEAQLKPAAPVSAKAAPAKATPAKPAKSRAKTPPAAKTE